MSEKNIKNSIDNIEPASGARDRMYQNIMKKAQQAEPAPSPAKKPIALRRYALPIAACLCLVILGLTHFLSSPTAPPDDLVLGGNPFVEVESADAFKALSVTLDAPADAQEVSYAIIDGKIAELRFTLDGKAYTARASAQEGDFSGLVGQVLSQEAVDAKTDAVLSVVKSDGTDYCRLDWTNGKIKYCLYGTDGASKAQVLSAYEALKK